MLVLSLALNLVRVSRQDTGIRPKTVICFPWEMESQRVDSLVRRLEVFRKLHYPHHSSKFCYAGLHRLWRPTLRRNLRLNVEPQHGGG